MSETLNFSVPLSLQNSKARLFRRETRAFSRDIRRSRRLKKEAPKAFLSLKLHSLKEKPPDFSLNQYTFLSQHDDEEAFTFSSKMRLSGERSGDAFVSDKDDDDAKMKKKRKRRRENGGALYTYY